MLSCRRHRSLVSLLVIHPGRWHVMEGALERMPKRALSERALLQGYSDLGPEQHLSALNRIGRNTRTLYVHAYQSYLWNHVISERIERFGSDKVLEGDLVMVEDGSHAAERRKTSGSRLSSVECITAEHLASNKYSIEDVVLPIPGASVVYPKNDMEAIYHELAARDNVSLTTSTHKVKEFNIEKLSGDYRKIIIKVPDLEYDTVCYRDSYELLLKSDWEQLQDQSEPEDSAGSRKRPPGETVESERKRQRSEDSGARSALTLKFTLPSSSYATMLVRQLTKYSTSVTDQVAISLDETKSENSPNTESMEDFTM